ncbi:MAG TPA: hypothetical protein VF458_08675, partial [Ktedonobacteraceae bacterium]
SSPTTTSPPALVSTSSGPEQSKTKNNRDNIFVHLNAAGAARRVQMDENVVPVEKKPFSRVLIKKIAKLKRGLLAKIL